MDLHLELEEKLARFKGAEAALSLQSGLIANVATVPALLDSPEDAVFTDALNHASIIDAVRLTKARRFIYNHNDVGDLEAKLAEGAAARRKLVVTDGVFSMDGDIAPLDGIVKAAEKAGALVMVDDAHGEGVLGSHGRGIADHFGLEGRVDIEVGTLSKAFGVVGGFVTGKQVLIDYLRQKARPFLFSSAVTPPDVAACIAAVDILTETDEPVRKLWANGKALKEGMADAGFDTGNSQTPITPVIVGEAAVAREFSKRLFDEHIFAQAIAFPTVPKGTARIRCMVSAAHTSEDIRGAIVAFKKVGEALGVLSRS
jgi:glycine C-acetyltransferase